MGHKPLDLKGEAPASQDCKILPNNGLLHWGWGAGRDCVCASVSQCGPDTTVVNELFN